MVVFGSAGQYVWDSPRMYLQWWLNLVHEDPGHVVVETALIAVIVYILIFKKTLNPKGPSKPNLSDREIDEILAEWKPEPLVPPLTEEEIADANSIPVVQEFDGSYLRVEGIDGPLLNMANFDFLGLGQRKELKAAAVQALDKYGCGSCGPRGFYGTIDVHMKIEDEVAAFMGTEEAISYSDSSTTISSAIPAFAKKGDLTIVDQGVEENVQTGINLSRSTVRTFKHNDMEDLERVLKEIAEDDKRLKRNVLDQRRFIVVEGLYRNYGDLCPLPRLLELKAKYCYRVILNEALSFGVLGATGRGLTEMHGVDVKDIEIVTLSMAHSLASVGGLCVGTTQVVDHQRLSAAGYCYSASAPPFVSAAASEALRMLRSEPGLVSALRKNAEFLHKAVSEIPGLKVTSHELSPIVHVALTRDQGSAASGGTVRSKLQSIARRCTQAGIALTASSYIPSEKFMPPPTLRITTNAVHTRGQLEEAVRVLADATAAELAGGDAPPQGADAGLK
ncbi:unnamed protein product [Ascophyllum nodosum]